MSKAKNQLNPTKNGRQAPASHSNGLKSPLTFHSQIIYLFVQNLHNVVRAVNGGFELAALSLPAADSVRLSSSAPLFRVDFVAELAFLANRYSLHDELHAARFPGSVLSVTVLSEVSPFPVAAGKAMLIKEAHVSSFEIKVSI